MNDYEAFHKAADYIEQHPQVYNFGVSHIPECGSPGCMLGYVCALRGDERRGSMYEATYGGVGGELVLNRMLEISREINSNSGSYEVMCHTAFPNDAARMLRLYAAKYLQPTSDTQGQRHTTPPNTIVPKYDFEGLAQRLAKEPRAAVGEPGAA